MSSAMALLLLCLASTAQAVATQCPVEGSSRELAASGLALLARRESLTRQAVASATSLDDVFVPVNGGVNRACRGSSLTDNSMSYYSLFTVPSLDSCKQLCLATAACRGLEFGTGGRCEIWTRAEGIGASLAVSGYTCLKFQALGTTAAPRSGTFMPVDGGENRACRGSSSSDNSESYFSLASMSSLQACKELCEQMITCQGVEYGPDGRCELWTRADGIGASSAVSGFTCLRYDSVGSTTKTTTTTSTGRCGRQIRWAPHPDKCLSVSDDDTSSDFGTNIQLWDCTSSMRDTKFLMPDGGIGLIRWSPFPHLCLGVSRGSNQDGTNIQLVTCDEAVPGQIFRVVSDSSHHAITWVNTDKCLDVQDGENTNGANLQIWWCLSSDWGNAVNQQFVVSSTDSCEEASATTTGLAATTSSFFSTTNASGAACCAEFGQWPAVDGVTCGTCTALVSTNPYGGRCDRYCESFGHVCVGAAEEENENCRAKYYSRCDQAVQGTSDMLCSCRNVAAPESCPTLLPPQPGPSPQPSPSPTPGMMSLVWSDEFDGDGPVDNSKWGFDVGGGGWGNNELQFYTDRTDNARQEGGVLKVVAECEDYGGRSYTSARVVSRGKGDWGPGHRIVARAKLPTGRGSWPAIWMLPTDWEYGGWPGSGEIDIMEHVGCDTGDVVGTVHTEAFNHMINTQKGSTKTLDDVTAWHTYTIDWEDSIIHWYVDDVHFHSFTGNRQDPAEWPFNKRFHLLLNIAVGGNWGGYCLGRPPSCSSGEEFRAEQVMEIDYVRIYALR